MPSIPKESSLIASDSVERGFVDLKSSDSELKSKSACRCELDRVDESSEFIGWRKEKMEGSLEGEELEEVEEEEFVFVF